MGEMTFDFPPALRRWIEQRVAEGEYADAAEYLNDLIRRDRAAGEDTAQIRALIEEAEASTMFSADPVQLIEEIIAEMPATNG